MPPEAPDIFPDTAATDVKYKRSVFPLRTTVTYCGFTAVNRKPPGNRSIRKMASGLYNWLPLGLRVLRKVENIVREEMNKSGAMEVLMPVVQPAELWEESGRWQQYGPELLRITDRSNVRLSPRVVADEADTVWPASELLNTMVWVPVASAAAMAMDSLKLTPLIRSIVAVSVVLVT